MILDSKHTPNATIQNLLFQQLKALITSTQSPSQTSPSVHQASTFSNLNHQSFLFSQHQMISKQSEFLEQIKVEIGKKKSTNEILFCGTNPHSIDILPIQNSFEMSNISSVQGFDEEPFKSKFGEEFQKSLLSSALNEVNENCSSQTYQAIKGYVLNTKQKQFELLSQKYEKLTKKHQDLQTSFIIKSTQLTQSQTQLKQAQFKIQQFDQEKKKLKIKSNLLSQKEKRVHKMETSLVFKQKMFNEGKKRYEREKALFLTIEERLSNLYKKMENIWAEILANMEKANSLGCVIPCETNTGERNTACWKKDVMKKCREQLIEQKNLLKQEEEEMEKKFQMIELMLDQAQKIINQKQQFTDPFTPDQSSILYSAK